MFSNHNYEVKTNDQKKIMLYFQENKMYYTINEDHESLIVAFEKEKQIKDFQTAVSKLNLVLLVFSKLEPTLDEVYDKLVIKGSVDTQKG
jgi:hypothetical protein